MKKIFSGIIIGLFLLCLMGCSKKDEFGIVTLPKSNECIYEEALSVDIKSMSLEDIQSLNNNDCAVTYNENGDISLINGAYTDYKVNNFQDAYNSLMAVKELLSIPMEEVTPVRRHTEENVGTYYTFGIKENDDLKIGWVIHVIVDDEGSIKGLTTSRGDYKYGYITGITDNLAEYTSDSLFDKLKHVETTAVDKDGNEVTISTLYDKEKDTYYLGNLERKIIFTEFEDGVSTLGKGVYRQSKDNIWDDPCEVSILNDFIRVYDFYKDELGIHSLDGSGVPIMVSAHNPYDVSEYYGIFNDFACFSFTDKHVGDMCIYAHEYTHGVLEAFSNGFGHVNEQGAINEGYAQIMGRIIESYLEDTNEIDWYSIKDSASAVLSEAEILVYLDNTKNITYSNWFYPPAEKPDLLINDYGKVHSNLYLLLVYAATLEEEYGLTRADLLKLWTTSMFYAVSDESYDTVRERLLIACELHNDEEWADAVIKQYENMRFPDVYSKDCWLHSTEDGYGRIIVDVDESCLNENLVGYKFDLNNIDLMLQIYGENQFVDLNKNTMGNYTYLLKEGEYSLRFRCTDLTTNENTYSLDEMKVNIKAGEIITIDEISKNTLPIPIDMFKTLKKEDQ